MWLALFAFYLLFAGAASGAEVGAAALVALVGCAFALYLCRQGHRPMQLKVPFAYLLWRVTVALARDTAKVGGALVRALLGTISGVIQRQPFDPSDDSEEEVGRRALVIFSASIAPNSFVLEQDRVSLLFHRLVPDPPKVDRRWPV